MARHSAAPLLLAALAATIAVARGQDLTPSEKPGFELVSVEEFRSLRPDQGDRKRLSLVYLKFNKVFRTELKLDGGRRDGRAVYHPLAGRLHVQDRELLQQLGANRDSAGQRLTPKRSNIQVFGVTRATARGLMLVVSEVRLLDSQLDRFSRAHEALADGDFASRRALADQIEEAVATYEDDVEAVRPLLARLSDEARAGERAQLPPLPAGVDARLAFGKRQRDVALLAELWAHPEVGEDARRAAEAALRDDLGARRRGGQWLSRDAFMTAIGFVDGGAAGWIPEPLAALQAEIVADARREKVLVLPNIAQQAAAQGKLLPGLQKIFAVAAMKKAHGAHACFPTRVERTEVTQKGAQVTWELWVMPTGHRLFFRDGVMTSHVDPPAAGEEGGR